MLIPKSLKLAHEGSFFEKLGKAASKYDPGGRRRAAAGGVMSRTQEDWFRAKFGTRLVFFCAAPWQKLEPETTLIKGARSMR